VIETLRLEPHGELLVARLGGEVDISHVPVVRDRPYRALDNQDDGLLVDLSEATYIDSAVVNLLFELADRLGTHQLRLAVVVPEGGLVDRVLAHRRHRVGRRRLPGLRRSDRRAAQRAVRAHRPGRGGPGVIGRAVPGVSAVSS
jgi:anti-anti-sigma factor